MPTDENPTEAFAQLARRMTDLMDTPAVRAHLGEGLCRELGFALTAYRQRNPAMVSGGQPDLFAGSGQ